MNPNRVGPFGVKHGSRCTATVAKAFARLLKPSMAFGRLDQDTGWCLVIWLFRMKKCKKRNGQISWKVFWVLIMRKWEFPGMLSSSWFLSAYFWNRSKLSLLPNLTADAAFCQATEQALKPLFFDSNACAGLSAEKGCGPNDRSLIKKEWICAKTT